MDMHDLKLLRFNGSMQLQGLQQPHAFKLTMQLMVAFPKFRTYMQICPVSLLKKEVKVELEHYIVRTTLCNESWESDPGSTAMRADFCRP